MTDLHETSHQQRRTVADIATFQSYGEENYKFSLRLIFLLKLDAPLSLNNFVGNANFLKGQGGPPSAFPFADTSF